ncbi:MAG: hypothetical protein JSV80_01170 [Acidobacteriota bacterium]|nr:MAG: hypothetical protein JSV80_01170 [Acidobacteriota bacterium]
MRRRQIILVLLALTSSPVLAVSFYFSPDVPTDDPSGATAAIYLPWQIIRSDPGTYNVAQVLPRNTFVDGLHLMNNGDWLFSVEVPSELPPGGGVFYQPGDVVRFDGSNYTLFFNAALQGVPASSNVDALFLVGGDSGSLILSFDVPTTIGANTYEPADLVRFAGGVFSLFLDASATVPPIPTSSNVTGADRRGGLNVLTFDVPTTLGAATYLPGQLVVWDPGLPGFATVFADPGWPLSSRIDAFAFLANPGEVVRLDVAKSMITAGDLTISWTASCSIGAEDYGIYEGTLGSYYSHTAIDCNDAGADLTEEVTPSGGDHYYLVVPLNPNDEGSYGRASSSTERPQGSSPCAATQELEPCP